MCKFLSVGRNWPLPSEGCGFSWGGHGKLKGSICLNTVESTRTGPARLVPMYGLSPCTPCPHAQLVPMPVPMHSTSPCSSPRTAHPHARPHARLVPMLVPMHSSSPCSFPSTARPQALAGHMLQIGFPLVVKTS